MHLNKSKDTNPWLMHWTLSLQPYRFRIIAITGKDNVGADHLNCLEIHAKFSRWLKVLRTFSKDGCNRGNKMTYFFCFIFFLEFWHFTFENFRTFWGAFISTCLCYPFKNLDLLDLRVSNLCILVLTCLSWEKEAIIPVCSGMFALWQTAVVNSKCSTFSEISRYRMF